MPLVISPDRLVSAADTVDQFGLNILIYGNWGSGKTTLCASCQDSPHGKDVLIIDAGAGGRSIRHRPDVKLFCPKHWNDVLGIYHYLQTQKHSFRTICLDTLTEIQDMVLESKLKERQKAGQALPEPALRDYRWVNDQILRMCRKFRGFAIDRGWNVIFTAHELEEKNEHTGAILTRPALSPKAATKVCAVVDAIGHLVVDQKDQRKLVMKNTYGAVGKFRQPAGEEVVPDEVELQKKLIGTPNYGVAFLLGLINKAKEA